MVVVFERDGYSIFIFYFFAYLLSAPIRIFSLPRRGGCDFVGTFRGQPRGLLLGRRPMKNYQQDTLLKSRPDGCILFDVGPALQVECV